MFEITDQGRCRAICTLLALAGLGDAWNADGPTELGERLRVEGDSLTAGQKMILSAAWALWDGSESIRLACLGRVDRRLSDALAELVMASGEGPDALERWIEKHGSDVKRSGIRRLGIGPAAERTSSG